MKFRSYPIGKIHLEILRSLLSLNEYDFKSMLYSLSYRRICRCSWLNLDIYSLFDFEGWFSWTFAEIPNQI